MPALAHRITLRPEMWLRRVDPAFVVDEVLAADAGAGQRRAARATRGRYPAVAPRHEPARRRRAGRGTRLRGLDRGRPAPERPPAPAVGADPGARPGGAADRPAAGARRGCWAGSTWCAGGAVRARRRVRAAPAARARRPRSTRRTDDDAPRRGRRASAPGVAGRQPATPSATTWWSCGPATRRWLAAARRPTGRTRSPWRPAGWAAESSWPARRCAGAGTRRPGRRPGWPPATGCSPAGRWSRGARGVRVYPVTEPFDADEAMPRAAGLVGSHRSRRPGEGGELAGVRPFGPGDRLRRIDWRVSLRTRRAARGRHAVRPRRRGGAAARRARRGRRARAASTARASVLDTTVRAAAAIAEHYLHRGDRVSLLEYGAGRPPAAPGHRPPAVPDRAGVAARRAGRRRPATSPYEHVLRPAPRLARTRWWSCSPRWSTRARPTMLARLARSGRFVVAVDTLPGRRCAADRAASGPRGPPALAARAGEHASASCASTACRWWPGPGPAASTWCCATWPGWPRRRGRRCR